MANDTLMAETRLLHGELMDQFTDENTVDLDRVKALIAAALGIAARVDYIEDRYELRRILRRWANYITTQEEEYPDVDIDRPDRQPRQLRTKGALVATPGKPSVLGTKRARQARPSHNKHSTFFAGMHWGSTQDARPARDQSEAEPIFYQNLTQMNPPPLTLRGVPG